MARSFAITLKDASTIPMQDGSTIAKDPVRADDKGHAEVVFKVTNTTDRPARALAKLIPQGDTKLEWINIKGEDERDFAPRAEQEFTVTFDRPVSQPASAKPADTTAPTAGAPATPVVHQYPFRFDVASPLDPQEDFTWGPIVTVEVIDKPPVPPPRRLWILFVILGALLLIGGIVLVVVLATGDKEETVAEETPTPSPEETVSPTPSPEEKPSPTESIADQCFKFAQARNQTLSPVLVRTLCRGTSNPQAPGDCARRAMAVRRPRTGITGLRLVTPENAVRLCRGTNDADRVIACFQPKIIQGMSVTQAISACARE